MSFRLQLILLFLLLTLSIGLTSLFLLKQNQADFTKTNLEEQGQAIASLVAVGMARLIYFDDPDIASDIVRRLENIPSLYAATLSNTQGKTLVELLPHSDHPPYITQIVTDISYEGVKLGQVQLDFYSSTLDKEAKLQQLRLVALIVGFLALGFLFAVFVDRRFLKRLEKLGLALRHVGETRDYQMRLTVDAKDEIGQVQNYFNQLVEQIDMRTRALEVAKNAAEEASLAKSRFLSSMSHELRTPLNTIIGFAQLLSYDHLSEKQQHQLQHISQAGENLLSLITQVMALADIEKGDTALKIIPLDLQQPLQQAIENTQHLKQIHQVQFQLEPLPAKHRVLADEAALTQIFSQLLSNAFIYNHSHGQVRVTFESMPLGEHQGIKISIHDTGIGIDTSLHPHVFEAFNRLGQENLHISGSGIGLTLSRSLVQQMHGQIGFSSQKGLGSCFWIVLPLAN